VRAADELLLFAERADDLGSTGEKRYDSHIQKIIGIESQSLVVGVWNYHHLVSSR
jgi:hypothetical protein